MSGRRASTKKKEPEIQSPYYRLRGTGRQTIAKLGGEGEEARVFQRISGLFRGAGGRSETAQAPRLIGMKDNGFPEKGRSKKGRKHETIQSEVWDRGSRFPT